MQKPFLIIPLLILFTSCDYLSYDPPEDQPVYFEYEYINFAWGYQHNGWIIDRDGNVCVWDKAEEWRKPDSTGYIGAADLEFNISLTDSVIVVVDSLELMDHVEMISGAKDGYITEPRNTAYDAGSSTFYAYYYDEEADAYQKIFLGSSGDFSSANTSDEAQKLVAWLREFGAFWL